MSSSELAFELPLGLVFSMERASEVALLHLVPVQAARAFQREARCLNLGMPLTTSSGSLQGSDSAQWRISNKYYTADVSIKLYASLQELLDQGKGSPAVVVLASDLEQVCLWLCVKVC